MFLSIVLWGAAAGVIHFVIIGLLYGNPLVDRLYARAATASPALKRWPSKPRYLLTQFLGTQVEVYVLTAAFLWLRPLVGPPGVGGGLALGALLAAVRVYPRFWNMWIQTTYPSELLAVELVNGSVGALAISLFLQTAAV